MLKDVADSGRINKHIAEEREKARLERERRQVLPDASGSQSEASIALRAQRSADSLIWVFPPVCTVSGASCSMFCGLVRCAQVGRRRTRGAFRGFPQNSEFYNCFLTYVNEYFLFDHHSLVFGHSSETGIQYHDEYMFTKWNLTLQKHVFPVLT